MSQNSQFPFYKPCHCTPYMTLLHPWVQTECTPAVTGIHFTQTATQLARTTSPPHSPTHPPRNRLLRRTTTKDKSPYVVNHPISLFMVNAGEQPWHFELRSERFVSNTLPLLPWLTSRQIAAAHFFLSPVGIVQNCDIVAFGRRWQKSGEAGNTYTGQRM